MIEPNEKHVLKAVAWDALRASLVIHSELPPDNEIGSVMDVMPQLAAKNIIKMLDEVLENTAKKLSDPDTWRNENGEDV